MGQVTDYTPYVEYKTPGLYKIINQSSGTSLDMAKESGETDTSIIGYQVNGHENQKWQIADVGDNKSIIICRPTGAYIRAISDGGAVKSSYAYPDHSAVHWYIKSDASEPKLTEFHSVTLSGDVLDLKDGSAVDGTEVRASGQNSLHNGQKWLLQKITN